MNGIFKGKVDLLSRQAVPGVWETDAIIAVDQTAGAFMIAACMELGANERQLLGFVELSEPGLYGAIGSQYEVPFISHEDYPGLILKAKVMSVMDSQNPIPGFVRQGASTLREDRFEKILNDAVTAYYDFDRHGNVERLERSISLLQGAVEALSRNDSRLPRMLNELGRAVSRRFERFGELADLNNAMKQFQAAVDLAPDGHPEKCQYLTNLGTSFKTRFQRLGNIVDLNEAISRQQAAVDCSAHGRLPGGVDGD